MCGKREEDLHRKLLQNLVRSHALGQRCGLAQSTSGPADSLTTNQDMFCLQPLSADDKTSVVVVHGCFVVLSAFIVAVC